MKRLIAFLCGIACFALTQIGMRIPLLAHFDYELTVLSLQAPLIVLLISAFSAGVFEETGRYFFTERRYNKRISPMRSSSVWDTVSWKSSIFS